MLRRIGLLIFVLGCLWLSVMVFAQDDAPVASGLNYPRHLSYGADGTLYIGESGTGGDIEAPSPAGGGTIMVGRTAQVTAISTDGTQTVFIPEITSAIVDFGAMGVTDILVGEESAWVLIGQGPTPEDMPEGLGPMNALVQFDLATMEMVNSVDLFAFEQENNPDGTDDLASNPQDFAVAPDGTVYIVDASGNSLLSWTEADGLQLVTAWTGDDTNAPPVPTTVAVDADGAVYVGFLTSFPFPAGGSRIEKWVDGALAETYEGLTLVTDVVIGQDGNIYAVQFASELGEQGFVPNSGSVVMVSADGVTVIAEGLNFPYGVAQSPDGNWVVSVNSAFVEPGTGMVLNVHEGMTMPVATPEIEPASTPEM
jgi:DNA-binding beta-propeller fold protein YncE